MLFTRPDYYEDFECIADKCEDTCCAGWQIVIDRETLKKYTKIKGDFRKRMWRSVNWFSGTFKQDKEKRCAFLNDRNLCDLYLSQGEEGFCKTCREYPRHTEEFEGVREITLSISCPEVARILMNRMEPVQFLSYEEEGEEEYEDFDPFFYSILEDARKEMITILQNRELTITDRILLVLGMAHDMQGCMNRQEMFSCSDAITKYTTDRALQFVREYQWNTEDKEIEFKFARAMLIEESAMAAATSLASCGIAYALRYVRAAMEGGVELGIRADEAKRIVMQTLRGAVDVLEANNSHPEAEIDRVTTPGGLTIKGLNAMEAAGFTHSVIEGLRASTKR